MKKVSLILAIVMVVGLLAGCGSAGSSSGSSSGGSSSSGSTGSSSGSTSTPDSSSTGGQQGSGKDLQLVMETALADAGVGLPMGTRTVTPADSVRPDFVPEDYKPTDVLDINSLTDEEEETFHRYKAFLDAFDEHYTGFVKADMKDFAVQISYLSPVLYCMALVLPEEGHQQVVVDQFNAFVLQQQKAYENYNVNNNYDVALAAKVEVAPTGEVIMAICKDSDVVLQNILDGLAA